MLQLQLQLFGSHTTLATDVKSRLSIYHSLFLTLEAETFA